MDQKTKALYLCIKKQISRENHPIYLINTEFCRVFSLCYKKFVNKSKASPQKLLKTLNTINLKVATMQSEYELPSPRIYMHKKEDSEPDLAPLLGDKPNYFLTNQVVGDAKAFIKILLSAVINYYEAVILPQELSDMKEDIVEAVTNLVLSGDVYKIMFAFFRVEYTKIEENLKDRYKEYKRVTPEE